MLQLPAGDTATWHLAWWPGRKAGAAPTAEPHPAGLHAPQHPLPGWFKPSWLWGLILLPGHAGSTAHTEHSNAVVQGDDNDVPVAGQDAAIYHVPRALHV